MSSDLFLLSLPLVVVILVNAIEVTKNEGSRILHTHTHMCMCVRLDWEVGDGEWKHLIHVFDMHGNQSKANITRRYAKSASSKGKTLKHFMLAFFYFSLFASCMCVCKSIFLLIHHLYMYDLYDKHTCTLAHTFNWSLSHVIMVMTTTKWFTSFIHSTILSHSHSRSVGARWSQKSAIRQIYINDFDTS